MDQLVVFDKQLLYHLGIRVQIHRQFKEALGYSKGLLLVKVEGYYN